MKTLFLDRIYQKKSLVLCCILLRSFLFYGQNHDIDSLLNVLEKTKQDTIKIQTLIRLSEMYLANSQYELATKNAEQGQKLSEKINYKKGLASSVGKLSRILWFQGNYDKAEELAVKNIELRKEIKSKKELADSYIDLGNIYFSESKFSKSMDASLIGLQLYEDTKDKNGAALAYGNIANIYYKQHSYSKALETYFRSLQIRKELNDQLAVAMMYNNIGNVYNDLDSLNTALDYYLKALSIREKLGNKRGIASTNNKLGRLYSKQGNHQEALKRLSVSLKLNEEIGAKKSVSQDYLFLGLEYLEIKKYDEAEFYLSKSLEIAKTMKDNSRLMDVYEMFSELYEKKKDFKKAYEYHRLYSAMNDSLFNKEYNQQIAEMTTKYETAKKDKALVQLQKDKKLQQLELNQQVTEKNNLLIIIISSVFIIIIMLLFSIILKRTNNKIKTVNETLVKQSIEIEQKNKEINRQAVQIARHQSQMNPHFIFNAINGLQSSVLEEDKMKTIQQIQSLSKLIRLTLKNSENEYISLAEEENYLNKYVEFELPRFIKKFNFIFKIGEGLNSNILIPTMLIQPFIENAIKHAGLNTISNGEICVCLELIKDPAHKLLKIIIRDNGTGIIKKVSSAKTEGHESKGIKITKQRIALELERKHITLNDYFSMKSPIASSEITAGTEVVIICPYYENVPEINKELNS